MHVSVRGGIRMLQSKRRSAKTYMTDDAGKPLSRDEAINALMDELSKGREVIPMSPHCKTLRIRVVQGFDYAGAGALVTLLANNRAWRPPMSDIPPTLPSVGPWPHAAPGRQQVNTQGHGVEHAQAAGAARTTASRAALARCARLGAELRMPNWPPTLAMTLQDPMRAAVIHARAAQLAAQQRRRLHQQARAHGQCSTDSTPASQQGLVGWWRGLRLVTAPGH